MLLKYLFTLIILSETLFCQEFFLPDDSLEINFRDVSPAQVYRETFLPEITGIDSFKIEKDFKERIDAILSQKYINNSEHAVAIYSLDRKEFLYQKNLKKQLTPASTTKLVTTFTALSLLGHESTVKTEIVTDAPSIEDSVLNGNIYIIGKGDALFTVNDLECLAQEISKLGIKKINGNIYGDGSFFDGVTSRWAYSGDDDEVQAMAPVTALSIEDNKATIVISSGNKAGQYVNVNVIPSSETFSRWVTAKVRSYKRKSSIDVQFDSLGLLYGYNDYLNEYERAGDSYSLQNVANWSSIKVGSKMNPKTGKQHFTVSGYLYPNKTVSYLHYILEPELTIAGALKSRLESGGIKVNGEVGVKSLKENTNTEDTFLLAVYKRKLHDIVVPTNKNSDNYYAENIFKIIGAYNIDYENNAKGTKAITKKEMAKYGIDTSAIKLNDGSGLSRRNLLTAESLVQLLAAADKSEMRVKFRESLSIAGVDGTLRKRMKYTGAENNLIGKTGTLRNVSALAGYIKTLDGENLCFAFLFRGNAVSAYKSAENELGAAMSEFFYYMPSESDE